MSDAQILSWWSVMWEQDRWGLGWSWPWVGVLAYWHGFPSPTAALCGSAVYRRSCGGFGMKEGGGREGGEHGNYSGFREDAYCDDEGVENCG